MKQHSLFQHYKLISHNIQIFTHVECLESFISEAELVISMCGYNTFTELIGKRKKIIVIPRWHSGSEQLIRAKALAKYYDGIWILQKRDFTIKKLDALINHVICSPPPKVKFKMKGNEGLISFFKKELGCE